MSASTSVQHFAPPFASLSANTLGLRAPWLSASHSQRQQPEQPHDISQQNHQQQRPVSGLDTLAEGSQYVLNHQHLSRMHDDSALPPSNGEATAKVPPMYANSNGKQNSAPSLSKTHHLAGRESDARALKKHTSTPVRRRISRACDQCNQLRTKCDGQTPCAHCTEFGLTCEYARERKKRGKASKKDLALQASVGAAGSSAPNSAVSPSPTSQHVPDGPPSQDAGGTFDSTFTNSRHIESGKAPALQNPATNDAANHPPQQPPYQGPESQQQPQRPSQQPQQQQQQQLQSGTDDISIGNFNLNRPGIRISDIRQFHGMHFPASTGQQSPAVISSQQFSSYHDNSFGLMNAQDHNSAAPLTGMRFDNNGEHGSVPFLGLSPSGQSPGWLSLPSPPPTQFPPFNNTSIPGITSPLRYPVLQPVLSRIAPIIPQSLACDLLELYFASFSAATAAQSPYVVGHIFRKQSILHPTNPRACSPALLASMLWVGAQTHDAPFLTSPPSARGRVCQKLLELTVGLLKPLIHGPAPGETSPNYAANMVINGVALGGFGVSMDQLGAESSATGAIDDIATYINLATVVSASEYKAASIRWWSAAWSLARELKLGREAPSDTPNKDGMMGADQDGDTEMNQHPHLPANSNGSRDTLTEEEREERRRIWWLLYAMDRHLALCYNRPLILLDKECEGLLQPLNDSLWRVGDFTSAQATASRRMGPPLECTDHSMFGFFLPLMTILGEIVELQMARNHPRFGLNFRNGSDWDAQTAEISRHLKIYEQSLRDFEARHTATSALGRALEENNVAGAAAAGGDQLHQHTHQDVVSPSGRSCSTSGSRVSESVVQTQTVVAYGTHIFHVLHILLTGKWDPISLLDDNDLWISSESFIDAMGHAVGAAEAANSILENDPDLSIMPFFFGVYLLQGSWLLLVVADKLQGDASPSVVRACETIIRATESCAITLGTQYQRNFRKVMRSALAQVRGRILDDYGEQQQKRREVLELYRWTNDGGGLAL